MIALTQEKREELANYARERLASHVIHGGCSDEEDILKIALASLTAVPVNPADCFGPVYLSPPVPEIKLPSIDEILSGYKYQVSPHDARLFKFMISEIKRLNGLGERYGKTKS